MSACESAQKTVAGFRDADPSLQDQLTGAGVLKQEEHARNLLTATEHIEFWLDIRYLLLGDFTAHCNAETDGFHVATAHSQVQRTALGFVQVVDV